MTLHMHVVLYLQCRVLVIYTGFLERRPVDHYGRLFLLHAQS